MMQRSVVATLLIIAIWVAYDACFVLRDTELGVLNRVGSAERSVVAPGLHFKLPFVTALSRVDARLRLFESQPHPHRLPDGRSELVSAVVAHRVADVGAYVSAFADEASLEKTLDDLARRVLAGDEAAGSVRADLRRSGVTVSFVEPLRTEPTSGARKHLLQGMLDEHEGAAAEIRAQAEGEAAEIRAQTEREQALVLSKARHDALLQRAKADAESAALYAAAYGKDPGLAELLQSLELYESAIHEDDNLILSTRSSLFRYLTVPGTPRASP